MSYRLLLFDLDGTLADTAEDITQSLAQSVQAEGLPPVPREKILRSIGGGVRLLIERTVPGLPPTRKENLILRFREIYQTHLTDRTRLYPGVADTLNALPDRIKIVLSNKPEAFCRQILSRLEVAHHFLAICGGDSFPAPKPDPTGVQECLRLHQANPADCLLIGDSGVDVQTARAAGVDLCAVTYGYHHPGELDGVSLRIDRFCDLLRIVCREIA